MEWASHLQPYDGNLGREDKKNSMAASFLLHLDW